MLPAYLVVAAIAIGLAGVANSNLARSSCNVEISAIIVVVVVVVLVLATVVVVVTRLLQLLLFGKGLGI
jgi:hypothetical protein